MQNNHWLPNEIIVTDRLGLRVIKSLDVPFLIRLWTDEKVRKHLGGILTIEKAEQRANEYIDKKGYFCVIERDNGKVIGLCSLDKYRTGDIEVSYQFLPEEWGKGFGREAIVAVIQWGFKNMGINHIIAVTQKTNIKSRKLLEDIGMSVIDEFMEFNEPQVMYSLKSRV